MFLSEPRFCFCWSSASGSAPPVGLALGFHARPAGCSFCSVLIAMWQITVWSSQRWRHSCWESTSKISEALRNKGDPERILKCMKALKWSLVYIYFSPIIFLNILTFILSLNIVFFVKNYVTWIFNLYKSHHFWTQRFWGRGVCVCFGGRIERGTGPNLKFTCS